MVDLRELAQAHPELLTRECEACQGEAPDFCEWPCPYPCLRNGRRLLTLEEALEAGGCDMLWHEQAGWGASKGDAMYAPPEVEAAFYSTPREAAYRLLIEVSRG